MVWPMVSQTACSRGRACSTFSATTPTAVPISGHSACSSASGATWVRSSSMCSASDSAQAGGFWTA